MTENLPAPRRSRLLDASVVDLIIRVACLALLLYWTAMIVLPFLPIMAWAVILAVVLYPGFVWCTKRLRLPPIAAALLMTAASLAVLFGPIAWLSLSLIESIRGFAHRLQAGDIPIPPPHIAVKSWPLIGGQLFALWQQASTNLEAVILQIGPELKPFAGTLLSFAGSSGISMLSFVIAVALSGFLFVPGPALADKARAVVRHVDATHGDEFMHLTSVTIRNLARGVIGVSLLQSLLIGIGLIVAGIPGAGLLSLCALLLGILQIGTMPVVVPILIFAWLAQSTAAALVLTLYLVPVGFLDTILRPIVMAHGLKTPMLVILIGVLGGVLVHGMIGVFVGPVVLAIAWELLAAWTRDTPVGVVVDGAAPPGGAKAG
jgi:predicted PurR-regulated permease PerM